MRAVHHVHHVGVQVILKAAKLRKSKLVSGAALSELANVADAVEVTSDPLAVLPAAAAVPVHVPLPLPKEQPWYTRAIGSLTGLLELIVIALYKVCLGYRV